MGQSTINFYKSAMYCTIDSLENCLIIRDQSQVSPGETGMLKLRVIGDEKKDIWLVEPGVVIGSAIGSGLILSSPGIKDKHAQVIVAPGDKVTLKNLSNDSHLLLNGKPAGDEKPLKVGDEISIGNIRLMVVDPKEGFVPQHNKEAPASPWSIRANHSALNNRIYPISGKTVLGRSNECDVVLSVTHLSRKHAELNVIGGKLVVKDLDSANGTFVNGKRVKEETLKNGDELRLDTLSFTVVGPADDMDKTSVRAAINPAALAAAAEKKAPAPQPAPVARATRAEAPAPTTRPNIPASNSKPADEPAEAAGGGNSTMIIAAVVGAVLVAVALFFVLK